MLYVYENGIRGEIIWKIKYYVEANNTYMNNSDPSKLSRFIMYLDFNNQCRYSLVEPIPYRGN